MAKSFKWNGNSDQAARGRRDTGIGSGSGRAGPDGGRLAIAIQGFGETHLLVPTGPGVREPQNRRVEIIIR